MNEHIECLMKEYQDNLPAFVKMKEFVMEYLKKILVVENKMFLDGLEGRVKEENSLRHKLELKGSKYKTLHDITDIFGARVITFYNDEVDIVSALIEKSFIIDYENSIDKRKILEVDRFGYMSLHYICSIPKSLYFDEEYPQINEYKFEIQMRTALQHVWATIFHDTGYKSDVEVPTEYLRYLSRLSGLLELADDEFRSIRDEINEYRNKIRTLVSKGNIKDITLNIDSFKSYLQLNPFEKLIKDIAKINNSEIEEVNLLQYYDAFVELGFKYLIEVENMRKEYQDMAYKLSLLQLQGTELDILLNSVAIRNLIIVYIVKNGGSENDIVKIYNILYGEKKSHIETARRLIEQCKGLNI